MISVIRSHMWFFTAFVSFSFSQLIVFKVGQDQHRVRIKFEQFEDGFFSLSLSCSRLRKLLAVLLKKVKKVYTFTHAMLLQLIVKRSHVCECLFFWQYTYWRTCKTKRAEVRSGVFMIRVILKRFLRWVDRWNEITSSRNAWRASERWTRARYARARRGDSHSRVSFTVSAQRERKWKCAYLPGELGKPSRAPPLSLQAANRTSRPLSRIAFARSPVVLSLFAFSLTIGRLFRSVRLTLDAKTQILMCFDFLFHSLLIPTNWSGWLAWDEMRSVHGG